MISLAHVLTMQYVGRFFLFLNTRRFSFLFFYTFYFLYLTNKIIFEATFTDSTTVFLRNIPPTPCSSCTNKYSSCKMTLKNKPLMHYQYPQHLKHDLVVYLLEFLEIVNEAYPYLSDILLNELFDGFSINCKTLCLHTYK